MNLFDVPFSILRQPRIVLLATLLAGTFFLPAIVGDIAAYVTLLSVVALAVLNFDRAALKAAVSDWCSRLFLLAYALLCVAFCATADDWADVTAVVNFLPIPLSVLAFAACLQNAGRWGGRVIAGLSLTSIIGGTALGIVQVSILDIDRAGFNSVSIFFSDLSMLAGFLGAGLVFTSTSRWRLLALIGVPLGFTAAALGETRGAIVAGFVLSCVLTAFLVAHLPRRKLTSALILLSVVALSAVFVAFSPQRVATLFAMPAALLTTGTTADESTNERLEFYVAGVKSFLDSPIVGHGWANSFSAAEQYLSADTAQRNRGPKAHLHSDAVTMASAGGLFGISALLLLIAAPIVGSLNSPHDTQRIFRLYATTVLSVGIFSMGLTDSMFAFELMKTVFCVGSVAVLGLCRDEEPRSGR